MKKELSFRTDLAIDIAEVRKVSSESGLVTEESTKNGVSVNRIKITTDDAAEKFGKAKGNYITVDLSGAFIDATTHTAAVDVIAGEISNLLHGLNSSKKEKSVLVVGLGNDNMSSDAIGPGAAEGILVTRHLKEYMPELYSELNLSNVSVLIPRVLGQTGIESADIIKAAIDKTSPDAVVVIDALASRSMTRLCKTVQITDTGITPGSGVGNDRDELSSNTLGLPVIAIGIPTVVDSVTLTSEVIRSASEKIEEGIEDDEVYGDFVSRLSEIIESDGVGMVVTPKDIDRSVVKCSRLLSLAINKALHYGLTQEEINALLDI